MKKTFKLLIMASFTLLFLPFSVFADETVTTNPTPNTSVSTTTTPTTTVSTTTTTTPVATSTANAKGDMVQEQIKMHEAVIAIHQNAIACLKSTTPMSQCRIQFIQAMKDLYGNRMQMRK